MTSLTKQDIQERFGLNLGRVRSLTQAYSQLVGAGGGRATVEQADILRAATVLLHAAMEDLLRSAEELKLPRANKASFDAIKFVPLGGTYKEAKEKFNLVDLAEYRGQTVDDVFSKAIDVYLERSNYNNIGEVKGTLMRIGIDTSFLSRADSGTLESMMKRRHWIVHRADRNPMSGRGHHAAQSIGVKLIEDWIVAVDAFGKNVLGKL